MGTCCSAEPYDEENNSGKEKYKLLFLGSGGCGKSTLFKQLRKLYGEGFTSKDRSESKHGIAAFVIETMQGIIDDPMFTNIDSLSNEETMSVEQLNSLQKAYTQGTKTVLTPEISKSVDILWKNPQIQAIFFETAKMQLNSACAYFLNDLERVSSETFLATDRDILMQRRPTIGLIEQTIRFTSNDSNDFMLVDVGGQKNERKKWIHHFESVSAVVYVISLCAYDQVLYEDENVNSLHDSIDLFKETINDHWFDEISFFLIFNKLDVFREKIALKSMKECFDSHADINDYDEDALWNECKSDDEKFDKNVNFIKSVFLRQIDAQNKERNKNKNKKEGNDDDDQESDNNNDVVQCYNACAYDPDQVKTIFESIMKDITKSQKPQKMFANESKEIPKN